VGDSIVPHEHEAIRGQALVALTRVAPRIAPVLLQTHLDDASAFIRLATVNALAETGGEFTLRLLTELLKREQDIGVRQRASLVVQSIGKRLRVRVPETKVPKRLKNLARLKASCRLSLWSKVQCSGDAFV